MRANYLCEHHLAWWLVSKERERETACFQAGRPDAAQQALKDFLARTSAEERNAPKEVTK